MGCVFYRVGDWDDLQIDLHVSIHDGLKIQFASIVPVFLGLNGCSLRVVSIHTRASRTALVCQDCTQARWVVDGVTACHWTLKRLERYLVMSGLMTEWSQHGGSYVGQKHAWEKIVLNFYFSWTVNCNKYAVLTTWSSTSLRTKKKTVKKSEIWVKFLTVGCVFYRVGDWDDLQSANWPHWLTYMSASMMASKYSLQVSI